MNKRDRSLFFVTDFLPLFVIVIIRYSYPLTDSFNFPYAIFGVYCFLFVGSLAISGLFWRHLIATIEETNIDRYEIDEYVSDPSPILGYLIPYIFGLISISLSSIQDSAVFVFLFILVAAIYINSDVVFFNPLLFWLDYKIYRIQARRSIIGQESFSAMCISQSDYFPLKQRIDVFELERGVIYIPKMKTREQTAVEIGESREQDEDDDTY